MQPCTSYGCKIGKHTQGVEQQRQSAAASVLGLPRTALRGGGRRHASRASIPTPAIPSSHPRQQKSSNPPPAPPPRLPAATAAQDSQGFWLESDYYSSLGEHGGDGGGGPGHLSSSSPALLYLIFPGNAVGPDAAMLPPSPLQRQVLSGSGLTDDKLYRPLSAATGRTQDGRREVSCRSQAPRPGELFPHQSLLRSCPSTQTRTFAPQCLLVTLASHLSLCAIGWRLELKELKPEPAPPPSSRKSKLQLGPSEMLSGPAPLRGFTYQRLRQSLRLRLLLVTQGLSRGKCVVPFINWFVHSWDTREGLIPRL